MRESDRQDGHASDGKPRRGRRGHPRASVLVLVLGSLALLASACITDGSWTATAPAPVGVPDTFHPQFLSVSCPTTTFCMGTGGGSPYEMGSELYSPVIQTWDGSTWTDRSADFPFIGPEGTSMASVSCASATSCMATYRFWVPADIYIGVAHWDGSTWTTVPVANFESFTNEVACSTDGTCLVASDGAEMYQWDGDSIEKLDGVTAPELGSLDCVSANVCWGIDGAGNEAWRWNGTTWTSMLMPTPPGDPNGFPTFYGADIDCSTSWWCVVVGQINVGQTSSPAAALWNGSAWSYPAVPQGPPGAYRSVSCVNGAECVAVGATLTTQFPFFDEPFTSVWNGTAWSEAPNPPGTGHLYPAVSCPMGADLACMAVGGRLYRPDSELVAARYTWDHSL